nr:MAG TPA: hypothetical protein [Caudoviricetes sp.]
MPEFHGFSRGSGSLGFCSAFAIKAELLREARR